MLCTPTFLLFVALLVVPASVILDMYRRDLPSARTRLASVPSSIFASPYGNIEYSLDPPTNVNGGIDDGVGGDGGRHRPVVLISHGLTGGIDQGMYLSAAAFPPGCCRFLYVSRFGYSKSDLPPRTERLTTTTEDDDRREGGGGAVPSARLQAAAYRSLLDHLKLGDGDGDGDGKVYAFGNSAGGPSVLFFAIDNPTVTRGIILHSSAGPGNSDRFPPELLFRYDLLYWAAVRFFADVVLSLLLPPDVIESPSAQDREKNDKLVEDILFAALPITERTDGILFDNEVSTPSVSDVPLEDVSVPALILQSDDDPRERAAGRALAGGVKGCRHVALSGGHLLLGQDEIVKKEIGMFLGRGGRAHAGR